MRSVLGFDCLSTISFDQMFAAIVGGDKACWSWRSYDLLVDGLYVFGG